MGKDKKDKKSSKRAKSSSSSKRKDTKNKKDKKDNRKEKKSHNKKDHKKKKSSDKNEGSSTVSWQVFHLKIFPATVLYLLLTTDCQGCWEANFNRWLLSPKWPFQSMAQTGEEDRFRNAANWGGKTAIWRYCQQRMISVYSSNHSLSVLWQNSRSPTTMECYPMCTTSTKSLLVINDSMYPTTLLLVVNLY